MSSDSNNEKLAAGIFFAALMPNYLVQHLFITDKQILVVEHSKMSNLLKAAELGTILSFGVWGVTGLAARSGWKKNTPTEKDKVLVTFKSGPDVSEILNTSHKKIPFEKIKEITVKKVLMASEAVIGVKQGGFLSSDSWAVNLPVDDIKEFLKGTPLSSKLK